MPWGPEVSATQRRGAQERLGQTLPKDSSALGLTWPARARIPVPFAELVAFTREGRFSEWRDLVPSPLREHAEAVTDELEAEWQRVVEGIAAFRVPAILMAGLPTVDDLARTFERLNTAGVDMGQEELFFSGIKLKWPEAHDLVWEVYSDMETGRFLAPTKIVHLAVRLASTREHGCEHDIIPMDLRAFRNNLESEGGDDLLRGNRLLPGAQGGSGARASARGAARGEERAVVPPRLRGGRSGKPGTIVGLVYLAPMAHPRRLDRSPPRDRP